MNIGREIVSYILNTGDLRPFLDAGLTREWMTSKEDLTRSSIFISDGSIDDRAYTWLLEHWDRHHKIPSAEQFDENFPAYRFSVNGMVVSEILELAHDAICLQVAAVTTDKLQQLLEDKQPAALSGVITRAARELRSTSTSLRATLWDDPGITVDELIERPRFEGIFTGVDELDRQFNGYQPGNFIAYVGRAKAGKTWALLLSALDSWHRGKKILFVTVEMTDTEISDRLNAMGARIELTKLQQGVLSKDKRQVGRLAEFREEMGDYESSFTIIQPEGICTAGTIETLIERYEPDVCYIDGFYFLTDEETKKGGGNWEGQDNLARDLKILAKDYKIVIITSTQVREKQLGSRKADVDDVSTMGGTALNMYTDMLWTINAGDGIITISQSRTRTVDIHRVKGKWDWSATVFNVMEEDDYGTDEIRTDL